MIFESGVAVDYCFQFIFELFLIVSSSFNQVILEEFAYYVTVGFDDVVDF